MALFLGKFQYVIDEKGRVNIPAKFREQLVHEPDGRLATIKGMDGCIFVYPARAFEQFLENFDTTQFKSEKEARRFQRLLADGANISLPDGQGRITLTDEQRAHAGLKRDVVLFGNFRRVEIWDPERLKSHLEAEGEESPGIDDLAGRFFQ